MLFEINRGDCLSPVFQPLEHQITIMSEGGISRAVLVTGCSSGIGRATALRLVRAGWPVYATARRPETLKDLAAAGCRVLALDVTDERSMRAAVETVRQEAGAVGVLINNAGYSQSGAVESVPIELARRQFETNLFGLLQCTLLVLHGMREQGWGRIVNLSSMGGKLTFPGGGLYHASKHAVEALSDALRFEVRGFGVDVIVIEPGLIRTGFGETAAASTGADAAGPGDSPYREFNTAVAAATRAVYESGALARFGGGPEQVAAVVERAISARRPRIRYRVTASARLLLTLHAALPDRAWDGFLRLQFPVPGSGRDRPGRR
jgi:NAD(P)-dependent dehydrogenase (short-subunit alcohol dehydrogenase family)